MKPWSVPRLRRRFTALLLAVFLAAGVPSFTVGTASAAVPPPPPGSGTAYTWHSKNFANAPYKQCVAKIGWANQQGYIYFKRIVDCTASSAYAYQLGSELYVTRSGSSVINGATAYCGNGATTPVDYCVSYSSVVNPSGSQTWKVLMRGRINKSELVDVPWFTFYA